MTFGQNAFRTALSLIVAGALTTACAPVQTAGFSGNVQTAARSAGPSGSGFFPPEENVIAADARDFSTVSVAELGAPRTSFVPSGPIVHQSASDTVIASAGTELVRRPAGASAGHPAGYAGSKSFADERDTRDDRGGFDSFDGVDVASADTGTDTGGIDDTGGAENVATSAPSFR